jgi:hypothetical protein
VQRAYRQAMPWAERLPTVKRNNEEEILQRSVMQFLAVALPPDAVAFAVPNGGLRSPREAARMKGMGVVAGIPDIAIVYRSRAFFIELKGTRGVMSAAQRAMADKLNYCGANVMLCRSVDECEAALREACVPLRATVS